LGFGEIPVLIPGVRRKAATPGFAVKPVPGKITPFFHRKILHGVAFQGEKVADRPDEGVLRWF
jgi:hypothetical protein